MHSSKRHLIPIAALAACAACIPTVAFADRAAAVEKLQQKFAAADSNHDGYLSRDEASKRMPRAAVHFDEIDTDHDGRLTRAEIAAYLAGARAARSK